MAKKRVGGKVVYTPVSQRRGETSATPADAGNEDIKSKMLEYNLFDKASFSRFVQDNKEVLKERNLFNPDKVTALWREALETESLKNLHPVDHQEAFDTLANKMDSWMAGWLRNEDSSYKPKIEQVLISDPTMRNAALNLAHKNYMEVSGTEISFDKFLDTEITIYRGGNFKYVDKDIFVSYSFDRKIAEYFAKKMNVTTVKSMKIKPRDTLGSLRAVGEAEILVPVSKIK